MSHALTRFLLSGFNRERNPVSSKEPTKDLLIRVSISHQIRKEPGGSAVKITTCSTEKELVFCALKSSFNTVNIVYAHILLSVIHNQGMKEWSVRE